MSLFDEIKNFVSKWIKNPIVMAAVAYIVYKTLSNYVKSESTEAENIKRIQQNGNDEVIYDTNTKMYIRITDNKIVETSSHPITI